MAPRIPLTQISSRAWEHPADRAALNTLRAIPGFDEVVRKIAGFFGERGVRQLFLANAVRVGPRQRPKLNTLYTEVLETLDWPTRPQLYVTQTPFVNAGAVGFDDPFIVHELGDDRDCSTTKSSAFILAHELGHIMSGHTTYRTIAIIILTFGLNNLPFLAGMALLPVPARAARVVSQERAVVRPRRPARHAGSQRVDGHVPQARRRRRRRRRDRTSRSS